MRNAVTLALIVTLLLLSIPACSNSNEIYDYLDDTEDIIADSQDTLAELTMLWVDIAQGQISESAAVNKLVDFENRFSSQSDQFESIDAPDDCRDYQEYCIEYLDSARLAVQDMQKYFQTGDEDRFDSAILHGANSDSAQTLASNEWNRLEKQSSGGGSQWWYIPLGLIGLAIAVYAGGCLLSLVFSIPIMSISIIVSGISSVFRRIRGG